MQEKLKLTLKSDALVSPAAFESHEGHGLWVVKSSGVPLHLVGVIESDHVAVSH